MSDCVKKEIYPIFKIILQLPTSMFIDHYENLKVWLLQVYIYTGLIYIFIAIFIIKYMKTRFGLKPEEYTKKDILTLDTK